MRSSNIFCTHDNHTCALSQKLMTLFFNLCCLQRTSWIWSWEQGFSSKKTTFCRHGHKACNCFPSTNFSTVGRTSNNITFLFGFCYKEGSLTSPICRLSACTFFWLLKSRQWMCLQILKPAGEYHFSLIHYSWKCHVHLEYAKCSLSGLSHIQTFQHIAVLYIFLNIQQHKKIIMSS